ncbi:hypothetical protein WJX73_000297 [Symbiochloris irregularis]|uniref:Ankyrin n=1 Tax=Symbiochloris irregularis TaxID=706552 RepID=A0AAW1P1I0_9CHLO
MAKILTDVEKGNTSAVLKALDINKSLCTAKNPRSQKTGLHLAAQAGHVDMVQAFLKAGASHEATDGQGNIPLHLASEAGHTVCVESLVGRGRKLSVKATNRDSRTPLHLAAMGGHAAAAKLLLAAGAMTQARDKDGKTPLDMAPSQSSIRAVLASSLPTTASPKPNAAPSASAGPATSAASATGGGTPGAGISRDPSIPTSPSSRPAWNNSFADQAPIPSQPPTGEEPGYMQPLRRSTQDSAGTPARRSATRSSSGAPLLVEDKELVLQEQAQQIAQLQAQVQSALTMLNDERAAHDETRLSALTSDDLVVLHRATSSVDDAGAIHKSTQWDDLQEQLGAIRESVQAKATEHGMVIEAGSFEDGKSNASAEDGTSLQALSAKLEQMEDAMRSMKLKPMHDDPQGSSISEERQASSYDNASRADRITEVDESEERSSSPMADQQPPSRQHTTETHAGPSRMSSLSSVPRSNAHATRTDDTEMTDMSEDLTLSEGRGGIGRGGVPIKGPLDKAARSGSRSREASAVPEENGDKTNEVSSGPVGTVKDNKVKKGCGCTIS